MKHFCNVKEISTLTSDQLSHYGVMIKPSNGLSPFISSYTSLNNWLAVIDNEFLSDTFNLFGIRNTIPNLSITHQILMGEKSLDQEGLPENIEKDCQNTYALLHARYIITRPGMQAMRRKYESGVFGECPRFKCEGQFLLPIGDSPNLNEAPVRTYCPKCHDVYESDLNLDGAHFGPSFPHIFLQMNRDLLFAKPPENNHFDFLGIPLEEGSEINLQRVFI